MRLSTLPDPASMDWQDWVDSVVGFNPELRNKVSPDMEWELFADILAQHMPQTPNPDLFDDWRAWADALKRVAST
jgi:hypothetical protein